MNQIDFEEDQLIKDYESGLITKREFDHEMMELRRDYTATADEAAREAYDRELGRWF